MNNIADIIMSAHMFIITLIGASIASHNLVTTVGNFSVCMYVMVRWYGLIAGFYTRGPYQFRVFLVYFAQLDA